MGGRAFGLVGLAAFATLAGAPAAALAGCTLGKIADFDVTWHGDRALTPVKLNGHAVDLAIDSGAFFSSLAPAEVHAMRMPVEDVADMRVAGVGGTVDAQKTSVSDFELAGATLRHVDFLVAGGEIGEGAVGLLGQNVLSLGDAEYDLPGGAVRLWEPKGCARSNLAYWAKTGAYSVAPLEANYGRWRKTIAIVTVNGVSMRAALDTGSPLSLMSVGAAARAGVRPDSPGVRSGGVEAGVGRRQVRSWIGDFASLKLGDNEEVKHTRLRFGEIDNLDIDMLLGDDFFLSHRVFVANSQHKVYITYRGGPVFDLKVHSGTNEAAAAGRTVAAADPSKGPAAAKSVLTAAEAQQLGRDAAVLISRGEIAEASAELDRALAAAPGDAKLLRLRAECRMVQKRFDLAAADLDATVSADPNDAEGRLLRAELRTRLEKRNEARADLDWLEARATPSDHVRLDLAEGYAAIDDFDKAIRQLDLWIAAHDGDGRMASALNLRCWVRAESGHELDRALGDCNRAVSLSSPSAAYFDSRGLVQLRRGAFLDAVADYDRALRLQPRQAWSLYGRGLAELKLSRQAAGNADIAAATAADPKLVARAKVLGLDSPSLTPPRT